jgi:hypothetical protein
MTRAQLCLDGYHPALFAAHFSHFGLLCFRIDQDCGFMPKTRGEFLNRLFGGIGRGYRALWTP